MLSTNWSLITKREGQWGGRLREGWVLGTKHRMSQVQSQRKDLEWLQGVFREPQGRMKSWSHGN